MPRAFRFCYITDRHGLKDGALPGFLREAIDAGVTMIQIREKDLGARPLSSVVKDAVAYARGTGTLIMVNDRLDIAWAASAAGVHLGRCSLPAQSVRAIVPNGFLVGVSCHSIQDVLDAESAGADYVVLGPIFETPSKVVYGPPLGLSVLSEVAARTAIPVYALGGITLDRAIECLEAGAAGIAGIRIFQAADSVGSRLAELKSRLVSSE
jgi:thiamine-phosphate pyrophosphorylase